MQNSSNNQFVSIIIPVHNRFALADEAIESVIKQTYRPLEIILVDDCSEKPYIPKAEFQNTGEVAIKIFRHETNRGPGASRETGRLAATGDYISYLDSDDLWHPKKLEKQVEKLKENPSAGMCYCKSVEFSCLPLTGNEPNRRRSGQEFSAFLPTIFSGRPWGTSACIWTRDSVEKIGPWSDAWTWEDYEYDCRAGCYDIGIVHIPETLCYYRINQQTDQLSFLSYREKLVNKVLPLLKMSSNLSESGMLRDVFLHKKILKLLRSNAATLLKYQENALALLLINELINLSKRYSFNWLEYSCINMLLKISDSPLSNRICARYLKL